MTLFTKSEDFMIEYNLDEFELYEIIRRRD